MFIILLVVVAFARLGQGSRVLELSDRFLDIRKDGLWLVKFYAPWCGHCKKLEPIYAHVAQQLHDSPIRVGKVDCTRFPSVGQEFKVNGFPTIIFMKGDRATTYTGERETAEIVKFAERMAGPPVKDLEHWEQHFFGFTGKTEGDLWLAFESLAWSYQSSLNFLRVRSPSSHEKLAPWISDDDQRVLSFKGDLELFKPDPNQINITIQLNQFIVAERFPRFVRVSRSNFQTLLSTKKYIVVVVVDEDKLGNVGVEGSALIQIVKDYLDLHFQDVKGGFQFGWCGSPELANSVAMTNLPIPTLLVINSTSFHHHLPEKGIADIQDLREFISTLRNQTATAYGGNTWSVRLYRTFYEGKTSLVQMWSGNPVLTSLLFGLPIGFMSLICYSICCADILDSNEEDDELVLHEKRE